MYREHAAPVLVGAGREAGGPRDAGDVDHRVQAAELVGQFGEQAMYRRAVGHRQPRCPGRTAVRHDAPGRGLLCRRQLFGTVDRDERIHGDDENPGAAQGFGDRGADPAATAGDHGNALPGGHSSVNPSNSPEASHFSSSSR